MKLFFVIVFSLYFEYTYQAGQWSYLKEESWPGKCTTGQRQSPINIESNDAILDKDESHLRGPLKFRGYENVYVSAVNNGHTLQWNVANTSSAPVLSGGPLRGNYTLLQFHLHWLSEHSINGYKYPLEIHMVHKKFGTTIDQALRAEDGIAVLGILGRALGDEDSATSFSELEPGLSMLLKPADELPISIINITRLFSPKMQSYYTYAGSLTTPECNEAVTWIVMDIPITISDNQFKLISKVDIGGISNYRSLKPVNNRPVYRSLASCSTIILPGFMTVLPTTMFLLKCTFGVISKVVRKTLCNIKNKILGQTSQQDTVV